MQVENELPLLGPQQQVKVLGVRRHSCLRRRLLQHLLALCQGLLHLCAVLLLQGCLPLLGHPMEPELGPSGYRPAAALLGRWLELLQRLVVCPLRAALWLLVRCLRLEIRQQIDIAAPHLEKAPDREASALGLEAESKEVASHSARQRPRANRHASLHTRLQSERQHILCKRGGEAGVAALKHRAAHRAHGRTLVAN